MSKEIIDTPVMQPEIIFRLEWIAAEVRTTLENYVGSSQNQALFPGIMNSMALEDGIMG